MPTKVTILAEAETGSYEGVSECCQHIFAQYHIFPAIQSFTPYIDFKFRAASVLSWTAISTFCQPDILDCQRGDCKRGDCHAVSRCICHQAADIQSEQAS